MKQWTCDWWQSDMKHYSCFTSDAVVNELESGDHPKKKAKLDLISGIDLLDINYSIQDIVEVYIANFLIPKNDLGDALHLAIASNYKIDYLLKNN